MGGASGSMRNGTLHKPPCQSRIQIVLSETRAMREMKFLHKRGRTHLSFCEEVKKPRNMVASLIAYLIAAQAVSLALCHGLPKSIPSPQDKPDEGSRIPLRICQRKNFVVPFLPFPDHLFESPQQEEENTLSTPRKKPPAPEASPPFPGGQTPIGQFLLGPLG